MASSGQIEKKVPGKREKSSHCVVYIGKSNLASCFTIMRLKDIRHKK